MKSDDFSLGLKSTFASFIGPVPERFQLNPINSGYTADSRHIFFFFNVSFWVRRDIELCESQNLSILFWNWLMKFSQDVIWNAVWENYTWKNEWRLCKHGFRIVVSYIKSHNTSQRQKSIFSFHLGYCKFFSMVTYLLQCFKRSEEEN